MRPWTRDTRGDASGRGEWRRRREANHSAAKSPCVFFQRTQGCRYGSACRFSHAFSPTDSDKRIVKAWPSPNDVQTTEHIWQGALEILNGNERDWKHSLPKDLDDDEFYGREHIKVTISCAMKFRDTITFNATSYFLPTMTHVSILDCLY